jgi:hypothetical protein
VVASGDSWLDHVIRAFRLPVAAANPEQAANCGCAATIFAPRNGLRQHLRRHQRVIGLTQKIQALSANASCFRLLGSDDSARKSKELQASPR